MAKEKGYALVMVLLIIALLSIFSMILMKITISSRMQYDKVEKVTGATDIAEMGITHYRTIVSKNIQLANDIANKKSLDYYASEDLSSKQLEEYYNYEFCNQLRLTEEFMLGYLRFYNVDRDSRYSILSKGVSGNCSPGSNLSLEFESEGIYKNEVKLLKGKIFISKNNMDINEGTKDDRDEKLPSDFKFNINTSSIVKGDGSIKTIFYDGNVLFKKDVDVRGNRELKINGDVVFEDILTLRGNSALTISGNVFLKKPINFAGSAYNICITGNVYSINENGDLIPYDIGENSCSQKNDDVIFVRWTDTLIPIEIDY